MIHPQAEAQKTFYDAKFKKIATPQMEQNIVDFYFKKIMDIIDANTIVKSGSRLLEIGVGDGMLMERMMGRFRGCDFKGIDISEKNITAAKNKGLNVEVADANNLEVSEKYDLIYGVAVLHHLNDIPKFFCDACTMLNEGGAILFGAEPVACELFYVLYHIVRGSWEIEKGMMNISSQSMRRMLNDSYKNIGIYRHGNAFVYCSKTMGTIWNRLWLSRIPCLNDIYIYAEKK